MLGHVASVGVPTSLNILFSCSSTSLPGNNGRPPLASSARIEGGGGTFMYCCVRIVPTGKDAAC